MTQPSGPTCIPARVGAPASHDVSFIPPSESYRNEASLRLNDLNEPVHYH